MIKFNRMTDEFIFRVIISDIHKYLILCSENRTKSTYTPIDINELLKFDKYNKIVSEFIETFKKTFTEEQTNEMFNRLKSLTIDEVVYNHPISIYFISLGYYKSLANEIAIEYYKDRRISKESIQITLIHELIHMASTRTVADGAITGFDIPYYLGEALNEGYTEYIVEKYFTSGMQYVKSGSINLFLAKGIENIVGQDKMQEYFFNADLNSLINELSKYTTKENIIKLLFLMDRKGSVMRSTKDLFNIIEEIAKINATKLKRDLDKGLISFEEYQIEYAKKVIEYLKGNMWSEETKVIKDSNSFVLSDQEFTSPIYEIKKQDKNKVKYYQ